MSIKTNTNTPFATRVTVINGWYHCRLYHNDVVIQEIAVKLKSDIGKVFRMMIRMEDKLFKQDKFTSEVRDRMWDRNKHPYPYMPEGKYKVIIGVSA